MARRNHDRGEFVRGSGIAVDRSKSRFGTYFPVLLGGRAARKNHTVNPVIAEPLWSFLMRSLEDYPKKTSSATESGRDMDAGRGAESPVSGEKRSARIQPSTSPAPRKVTAVGRS